MKKLSVEPSKKKSQKEKEVKPEAEAPKTKESEDSGRKVKVSRLHDFSHTHPDHAHHKTFGMDHEPGAF